MKLFSNVKFICVLSFQKPIRFCSKRHIRNYMFDIYNFKENQSNYTMEHVIPQSLYKNDTLLSRDLHNIFPFPAKINSHRSNYQYVENPIIYGDSKILNENGDKISFEDKTEKNFHIKNSKKKIFYPKPCYRGEISRAAMYFSCTYPEYRDEIFKDVICPYTILYWHHQYKPSEFEIYKSKQIRRLQGNSNIFVEKPEILLREMELILNKKFDQYHDSNFDK